MYCSNCGKENPDGGKFCLNCGAPLSSQQTNNVQNNYEMPVTPQSFSSQPQQPVQNPPKKKRKGCLIGVIVVIVFLFVITMIGLGNSDEKTDSTTQNSASNNSSSVATDNEVTENKSTSKAENESTSKNENNISNYKVVLKDHFVTNDYEGKSVLVVTYTFTNNSKEKTSWRYTIEADAFQDGIGLNTPLSSYGINGYDFKSCDKEIMPGKSVDVQEAYYLDDAKTDVEIQLSLFSVWTDKVFDTFTIKLK